LEACKGGAHFLVLAGENSPTLPPAQSQIRLGDSIEAGSEGNFRKKSNKDRAVAQTVFLDPLLMGVQKSLFAAQKSFFDNSKDSAPLEIQNSPFRLRQLNCGRYPYRVVTEKHAFSLSERPF
jgi:hypothetical protein